MLKKLIDKLLCNHEWETIQEGYVYLDENDKMPAYKKLLMVCTKCGKIKKLSYE